MAVGGGGWMGLLLLLLAFPYVVHAQPITPIPPMANLSTSWTNTLPASRPTNPDIWGNVRFILIRQSPGGLPTFGCGFFCTGGCTGFQFGVFATMQIFVETKHPSIIFSSGEAPHILWSANRGRPVGENATLELTAEGNLILRDVDGTEVWSTGTPGKSVVGMNLTTEGNLVLFEGNANKSVWQSFDHPADVWVMGQKLRAGQNLTANSSTNMREDEFYYFSVSSQGLFAYFNSDPPVLYYKLETNIGDYVEFVNGSIQTCSSSPCRPQDALLTIITLPFTSTYQYVRMETDGHLRLYNLSSDFDSRWDFHSPVRDLFDVLDVCDYPMICGRYGICSNGQCSCPVGLDGSTVNFRPSNYLDLKAGCLETSPLSCRHVHNHRFLRLQNMSHLGYMSHFSYFPPPDRVNIDEESCIDACLKDCSCKASFFGYRMNTSMGNCYLSTQVYSMKNIQFDQNGYNSTAFLKVQTKVKARSPAMLIGILGALFAIFLMIGICVRNMILRNNVNVHQKEYDEELLNQLPGMPRKFSSEELRVATNDFSTKLGQGGFGSVFGGTLVDGAKVAVKCLDNAGQGVKEFLAELQIIGSIQHVNLVRLIGYCVENSCRLLVYEFMCNGSLEKWIFQRERSPSLDWQTRKNIILDVAKALCYLHEECRQRIVHLDIKPPNILLDVDFHAKVSDFGLSKLIDRDQSHVVTMMRGTPGYLAPEWLSYAITEKVDIYSYGVVVLEIVCGRRNLDRSQHEEGASLVALLKIKAEENRLFDIVDKNIKDIDNHFDEVIRMLKLAIWCLQHEHTRRPSMSNVLKAIEGSMDVESIQNYTTLAGQGESSNNGSTSVSASLLSGPR